MKKPIFFTVSFLLFFFISNAQNLNWKEASMQKGANYFDIVKENRKKLLLFKGEKGSIYEKKKKQFERWAYFWGDRINSDGSFMSAYHTYKEWKKDNKYQMLTEGVESQGPQWSLMGLAKFPSNYKYSEGVGRLNAIAFVGSDTNTIYVGSPGGGIWKTTDAGKNWIPKGDDFPNMGVSDIVIDPNNKNILYLATGDYDGAQNRSLGVLKSINAGDSWDTTGFVFRLDENNYIVHLLIDPNNTNTIFATTKSKVSRTKDGGVTWTDVLSKPFSYFSDIEYKKGNRKGIIYLTSRENIYKSIDNGVSWSIIFTLPNNEQKRLNIAQTDDDTNLILCLDESGAIRKSTDEGKNWTKISDIKGFNAQSSYNMAIAISPVDKNLVLVGGVNGWRSKNGGITWEKYLDGYWNVGDPYFRIHPDHHSIRFVPGSNIAFSLNDGGINKGDASLAKPWRNLSEGLSITQYYNVSGTPQDPSKLIVGAQDNDVHVFQGTSISIVYSGDGVEGLWDYSNSKIAWTCSQLGYFSRTMDGFVTFNSLSAPVKAPFIWKLEIHPTIPSTIYGGFADIYKSTDRGTSFTNMNSGAGAVTCISLAPNNGDVIYVAGENGLRKTIDGGTSWTTINHPHKGFIIKGIAINPTDSDKVYICYSGYNSKGHVYKSTDGGVKWINISANLPNIPTHDIDFKTGTTDGELFLATDLGVYYWKDSAANWLKLDKGLPNVIVHDIEIHYGTEKIRVATYGRGLWEASIKKTGIKENSLPINSMNLYPNPTKNKKFNIRLDSSLKGKSRVLIYNVIGSVVKDFNFSKGTVSVDLSDFSSGMYLVKIFNKDKSLIKKLFVE